MTGGSGSPHPGSSHRTTTSTHQSPEPRPRPAIRVRRGALVLVPRSQPPTVLMAVDPAVEFPGGHPPRFPASGRCTLDRGGDQPRAPWRKTLGHRSGCSTSPGDTTPSDFRCPVPARRIVEAQGCLVGRRNGPACGVILTGALIVAFENFVPAPCQWSSTLWSRSAGSQALSSALQWALTPGPCSVTKGHGDQTFSVHGSAGSSVKRPWPGKPQVRGGIGLSIVNRGWRW